MPADAVSRSPSKTTSTSMPHRACSSRAGVEQAGPLLGRRVRPPLGVGDVVPVDEEEGAGHADEVLRRLGAVVDDRRREGGGAPPRPQRSGPSWRRLDRAGCRRRWRVEVDEPRAASARATDSASAASVARATALGE